MRSGRIVSATMLGTKPSCRPHQTAGRIGTVIGTVECANQIPNRKGSAANPFAEIVKAEAYTDSAGNMADSFGLRLKLRRSGRKLQMTQVDCSGDAQCQRMLELAERINRFLEKHSRS